MGGERIKVLFENGDENNVFYFVLSFFLIKT